MIEKLMVSTPNKLEEEDYEILAEKTEGYSGSDISVLVRDAVYEPLRRCRESDYFKAVSYGSDGPIYEPCPPSENGA